MTTAQKLRAVKRASLHAMDAVAARDNAIRHAHADGLTLREIASVVGLSRQRVHQIVHNR